MMNDVMVDKLVRIAGTQFDRHRRFTDKQIDDMKFMVSSGRFSYSQIAKMFNASIRDVKYWTDPSYKKNYLAKLSGKHTGVNNITRENRIAYKRELMSKYPLVIKG